MVAIYILLIALAALSGAAAGWQLRGGNNRRHGPRQCEAQPPEPAAPQAPLADDEASQAQEVLSRLHDLAARVAADVDEHSSRVQEISDELNSAGNQQADAVVAAVSKLIQANERMQLQLESAERKLQEQARQIESHVVEARTDALTQLANRRAFDDEIASCVGEFQRSGRPSSLMLIDVDHFKTFNDTYGHQAGDEVLRGVAETLRENLPAREIVARYGGEEFAVIFSGSAASAAGPAAERARAAIAAARYQFEDAMLQVTASAGLAELLEDEDAESLIKRADEALYASKQAGRNCGHLHNGQNIDPLQPAAEPFDEQRDPLTGLSNRTSFCEDVSRRLAEYKRGGSLLSVLLVQVDDYARIVDRHGIKTGEIVLRATTQFLKAAMRDTDHVARYDRHRFSLLLPGAKLADAIAVAERLRRAIARCKLPLGGQQFRFTISLGMAQAIGEDAADLLLERAGASLEAAVKQGGNCSFFHNGRRCEAVNAATAC